MSFAWSLATLATYCGGQLFGEDVTVSGLAIDSRQVKSGDLFVALVGERVDGHQFVPEALERGAVAAVVTRRLDVSCPQLLVNDGVAAMGRIGAAWRDRFGGPVVGITGSAGKTTAKTLIAQLLATQGEVLATQGNLNNELGVPLTLAGLSEHTDYAVVEMGAGKPGDIDYLRRIVRPSVAVLLNAGTAHLANYPSVDDIAQTKGAIVEGLGPSDFAVITADSPYTEEWIARAAPATVVTFGQAEQADIRLISMISRGFRGSELTVAVGAQQITFTLAIPGLQGSANALAALGVGHCLVLDPQVMAQALTACTPLAGRGLVDRGPNGSRVVDDCYNANPQAVKAAIDVLAHEAGTRHLVLGAMLELGEQSDDWHRQIGRYAQEKGIEHLWVIGPVAKPAAEGFGPSAVYVEDKEALLPALPALQENHIVLVKGSRGAALEGIVSALLSKGTEGRSC